VKKSVFVSMCFSFVIAVGAYSRSFCEIFGD